MTKINKKDANFTSVESNHQYPIFEDGRFISFSQSSDDI